MKATICLNRGDYKAKPLRYFEIEDVKKNKKRTIGVPTVYDRAMQVLYAYALEPISEATADRKSFAFRKGRSAQQAHAHIYYKLTENQAPEWVLIADVKSFYHKISHQWLIENIPIPKHILKEFIKHGYIFKDKIFNEDEGINLGCNLSTILGNMTLDGLQKVLYDIQGDVISDYNNGYCVRYADDICILAQTYEDAINFKNELEKFLSCRGLNLSQEKTRIINVTKEPFEYLSRTYFKNNGIVICEPAEAAVDSFLFSMQNMINANEKNWSQRKMILSVNAKIIGFATYHKCENSLEVFKRIDAYTNLFLLEFMRKVYPKSSKEQLIKKYWLKDSRGRWNFALTSNRNIAVRCMEDIELVEEKRIDISRNVFLDIDYFDELSNNREIRNISGKYQEIWNAQEGLCYICNERIRPEQEKSIIYKNNKCRKK